jgi:hypothetical protein
MLKRAAHIAITSPSGTSASAGNAQVASASSVAARGPISTPITHVPKSRTFRETNLRAVVGSFAEEHPQVPESRMLRKPTTVNPAPVSPAAAATGTAAGNPTATHPPSTISQQDRTRTAIPARRRDSQEGRHDESTVTHTVRSFATP